MTYLTEEVAPTEAGAKALMDGRKEERPSAGENTLCTAKQPSNQGCQPASYFALLALSRYFGEVGNGVVVRGMTDNTQIGLGLASGSGFGANTGLCRHSATPRRNRLIGDGSMDEPA